MMSLVESPDDDEEDEGLAPPVLLPFVLAPPVPLSVGLAPPLLDGEPDAAVCVAVTLRLLPLTDLVAVGAASATGPTEMVEVVVGVPGLIFPESSSWAQVSMTAATSPLYGPMHVFAFLYKSSCVPHAVSENPRSWTLPLEQGTVEWDMEPRPMVTMHIEIEMETVAFSVLAIWH